MFKYPLLCWRRGIAGIHKDLSVTLAAVHTAAAYWVVKGLVFPVSPQLVPLHSVTVIEGHRAAVGNGIETELLCVLRVPRTDIFPPAEGEYLYVVPSRLSSAFHTGFQPEWGAQSSVFRICTQTSSYITDLSPGSSRGLHWWVEFWQVPSYLTHEPFEALAVEIVAKFLLSSHIPRGEMPVLRSTLVNVLCVFIHPHFSHTLQVPCQTDSCWNLVRNIFPVDVTHSGARDVLHATPTHPHSKGSLGSGFCNSGGIGIRL